jgi:hypothetical protein
MTGPDDSPDHDRTPPLGAPTDPLRPTGRAAGTEPSRPGKDTKTFLYLFVLLGCLALGALALFFLLGFSLV